MEPASDPQFASMAAALARAGASHVMVVDRKPIALTPANAAAIQQLIAEAKASHQPTVRRQDLLDDLANAQHAVQSASERAYRADTGAGFAAVKTAEQREAAAREALAAYDAAHPEIAARIEARRRESRESFLAST